VALAKKHFTNGTLVLYNVSSSYMEGRCCALAKPGYSRDHGPAGTGTTRERHAALAREHER